MSRNRPLILVTRPRAEGEEFGRALTSAGCDFLLAPMIQIVPLFFQKPDMGRYGGLVFTSTNGVKFFAEKVPDRGLTVFAVGPQTEAEARKAGFRNVISGGGDAGALIISVKSGHAKDKPLLFVRGDHVASPVDEILRGAGYMVESLTVYASKPVEDTETDIGVLLKNRAIDAVTFFSKRTAEQFMAHALKKGFQDKLMATKALCLGNSMVECVQPSLWQNVYVASQPDRDGMLALIRETCKTAKDPLYERPRPMTVTADPNSVIPDAEKIIERFGGIRPMASKMEIPVTTVQGWKKRNAIPVTRKEDIVAAARMHNVQISDLISSSAIANENALGRGPAGGASQSVPSTSGFTTTGAAARPMTAGSDEMLEERFAQLKASITRSTMINGGLVILCVVAIIAVLWPSAKRNEQHIEAVQMQVEEVQEEQSSLRALIPANLQERLTQLQEQAAQLQSGATSAMDRAENISNDVLGQDAGTLEERITRLETHITEMGGSPKMIEVLERIKGLQQTVGGQQQLDEVVAALSAALTGAQGEEQVNQKLEEARTQNPSVGQTFENVPAEDLKAAAMLVGLSQFRESLNRDNQPFNDDLGLMMNLVGEDSPELKEALTRLAPQAEKGVLTPEGLSNEFKGLTGDIVVSSLKGEDVSIQEKAKARLNELLAIEKDGQLITGTDTQATVARTQSFLNEGDLAAAIGQVETLDGPAAEAVAPWLDQAKATLMAQQAKELLSRTINMKALGGAAGITAGGIGSGLPGGSELIQDKETGISILKPAPHLPRQ